MATTYLWVNGQLVAVGGEGAWSAGPSGFLDWSVAGPGDATSVDRGASVGAPVAAGVATATDSTGAQAQLATTQNYAATVLYATDAAQLAADILTVDAAPFGSNYVIEIGTAPDGSQAESPTTIHLTGDLPVIEQNVTIEGNGSTIDGGGSYRGLLAYGGTVELDNLTFSNTLAEGGKGGSGSGPGGGGGGGLGGGLFVASGASVTIDNVNFLDTAAQGGAGGVGVYGGSANPGGAGGGGMGGNGGTDGGASDHQGGGGGGIGVGANGGQGGAHGYTDAVNGLAGIMPNGAGGDGSSYSVIYRFLVYNYEYFTHGGGGGASGGGGGGGAGGGGGGGGYGGAFPGNQRGASYGVTLNFNVGNMLIDLLAMDGAIGGSTALGLGLLLAAADYELKAHGLGAYAAPSWHVTNDAGDDSQGVGVPGLQRLPLVPPGFGIGVSFALDKSNYTPGGDGGFGGGGGGGGADSAGGLGGFGGGGGGNGWNTGGLGGVGGWGGGAGGSSSPDSNVSDPGYNNFSVFGGGLAWTGLPAGAPGTIAAGGGGLGAGGAIFVENGGQLIDKGSSVSNASVTGGPGGAATYGENAPGSAGLALGRNVFLQGDARLTEAPDAGTSIVIGNIADEAGTPDANGNYSNDITVNGIAIRRGSVGIEGTGTVVLTGTNTYLGGTWLNADLVTAPPGFANSGQGPRGGATLEIAANTQLWGGIYVYGAHLPGVSVSGATLVIAQSETIDRTIVIENPATTVADGQTIGTAPVDNPLVIDLSKGGAFTGKIIGLQPGQSITYLGLATPPAAVDNGGSLTVSVQYYGTPGAVSISSHIETPSSTQFWVGSYGDVTATLAFLAANLATIPVGPDAVFVGSAEGPAPLQLSFDAQIGNAVQLTGTIAIPNLGQALALENNGIAQGGPGGGAWGDGQHDTVEIYGGAISLNPGTPLQLWGGSDIFLGESGVQNGRFYDSLTNAPWLDVASGIIGSAGLSTSGAVRLSGSNSFAGGIDFTGVLELAVPTAGGTGPLHFFQNIDQNGHIGENATLTLDGVVSGKALPAVLRLDGTIMPANTITDFEPGNTIDLPGLTATGTLRSDGAGNLVLAGQTLHFDLDIPGGTPFLAAADGTGGTQITLPGLVTGNAGDPNYTADQNFTVAVEYLDLLAGTYSAPDSRFALFTAQKPAQQDVRFAWTGNLVLDGSTPMPEVGDIVPLPEIDATVGHDFYLDGGGGSVTNSGFEPLLTFGSGRSVIQHATLLANGAISAGNWMDIKSGATVELRDVDFAYYPGGNQGNLATIEAGGLLLVDSGTIDGGVVQAGVTLTNGTIAAGGGYMAVAPAVGDSVVFHSGGVSDSIGNGTLVVGNPAALAAGGGLLGGSVNMVLGNAGKRVLLLNHSTLDLFAGSSSTAITLASPIGATVIAHQNGAYIYLGAVTFNNPMGEIDVDNATVGATETVSINSTGSLVIPGETIFNGLNRAFLVGGAYGPGAQFLVVPNGAGQRILPQLQSTTIASETQFDGFAGVVTGLPNAALTVDAALGGMITLTQDAPGLVVPANVALVMADGTAGPGGFVIAPGVSASLDGANLFSGGVTLQAGATLAVRSLGAGGSAGFTFAGADALLDLVGGDTSGPITGMLPSDLIHVAGATSDLGDTASGTPVLVDGAGHAEMSLSGGGHITLDLPDLANQSLLAFPDGSGGSYLDRMPTIALANDTGASASDGLTDDATLKGVAAPGLPVSVTIDGTSTFTVRADAEGNWSATPAASDGVHAAMVAVYDGRGVGIAVETQFTLDTTPPLVTIDITAGAPSLLYGTAMAGGVVTVDDGGAIVGSATVDGLGDWNLTATLPSGNYTLTASEPDAAGNSGVAGVAVSESPTCFLAGTRIRTESGEVAVEDLRIGARVVTHGGALRPIRWVGRRAYAAAALARNPALRPVRITAAALGAASPAADLLLSPNHALRFDTAHGAVLINAGHLVNGLTITQDEPMRDTYYYHIELDDHDVIFAEGAPAETFLDAGCRGIFHNAAEFAALYPGAAGAVVSCLKRVEDGLAFAEVLARLEGRAGFMPENPPGPMRGFIDIAEGNRIEGWVQDLANPDQPVMIEVVAGDAVLARAAANIYRADLAAAGIGTGRHAYRIALPGGTPCGKVTLRRQEDGVTLPRADAKAQPLAA